MSSLPQIITFIIYFIFIFLIAVYSKRGMSSLSGFILSNRSLSGPVTALGAGASDMSGWLLLALPGTVFVHGLNQIWLPIGLTLGAYLNWRFVAGRLRVASEKANDAQTIPEYFDRRFKDRSGLLRMLMAVVILLFFTFYASSALVGGAVLFHTIFALHYRTALWLFAILIMAYTSIGGFLAVNRIDFFQGCLMFAALLAVPIYMLCHGHLLQAGTHVNLPASFFHPLAGISAMTVISLLAWGLGYFGQPHILVRFMAAKSPAVLPQARRICTGWMICSLIGAMGVGLLGAIYYHHNLKDPESIFLHLSEVLFNPWIAGILLAAVLSAIMSTISAQLLAASSALTADIYKRFFNKKAGSRHLLILSRVCVMLITLLAIVLAMKPNQTILALVSFAWGGLGATFGPVMLLSLYWKNMTRNAALGGVIAGAVVVVAWKLLAPMGGAFALYEIVPGFLANLIVSVAIGLWEQHAMSTRSPIPEMLPTEEQSDIK